MFDKNRNAEAFIQDGKIIIYLDIENLPMAIEAMWQLGIIETRYKVTDQQEFAKDMVSALNREEEDGTTFIHELFDAAAIEAIEQGSFGVEEHQDQTLSYEDDEGMPQ